MGVSVSRCVGVCVWHRNRMSNGPTAVSTDVSVLHLCVVLLYTALCSGVRYRYMYRYVGIALMWAQHQYAALHEFLEITTCVHTLSSWP